MTGKAALTIAAFAVSVVISAIPLRAHHSFAAVFDESKQVKLQGTVTKVEWMNPHIWFYLDVKTSNGSIVKWQCEGGNPNTLLRQGWTRDSLKVGMAVDIDGWQARDGSNTCNARSVTVNGKRLFAGSSFSQ
jgi:hypothetical protein